MNLRVRLVLLALLSSLPLLAIALYTAYEVRQGEVAAVRAQLAAISRAVETRFNQATEAGLYLLHDVARRPDIARGTPAECESALRELLAQGKRYVSFFRVDAEGRGVCHSAGFARPTSYADRPYFQRLRASRQFTIGSPQTGRVVSGGLLPFAYPLPSPTGEFTGAIVAGLDLRWFGELVDSDAFPDIAFTIWSADGTVLYRHPDAAKWVGKRAVDSVIGRAVLSRRAPTLIAEAENLDGQSSMITITGLERWTGDRAAFSVALPTATLFARSEQIYARILVYFGIAFVLALGAALAMAEFGVRRPVTILTGAARRLAAGDLGARVGVLGGGGELASLERTFDVMAARLEDRELELRRAHQVARVAHIVTVKGGGFERWSDNLPTLLSLDPAATPSSTRDWLHLVHPEDAERFRAACIESDASGERVEIEYRLQSPGGDCIHIRQAIEPLEARAGDGPGAGRWLSTLQDVSEQKRAQEEIVRLNVSLEQRVAERTRELELANRAKSDFLANMSHELRTPLNSIIGVSEMLKDGLLGELQDKQLRFVTDVFDAGTHLLALINDILDLSKVEAGVLRLEVEAADIGALLRASPLVVREKAAERGIRIEVRVDAAVGMALADERKLKQVVFNLLANAVKFTPQGGTVTLAARRCARGAVGLGPDARVLALPAGDEAEFLEIAVEDTGVGMAAEDLGKLFEPFTQVDSSKARRQGGAGLGLSIVRRLAQLHGGTVGVSSRLGVGSRFCVWLPYRAAEVATTPEARPALAPGGASGVQRLALVVEDDDRVADLIEGELRREGFEVMRASTAEEGLVQAGKRRPQLITLDIFLPSMDGWEFMRRLKADPKVADTPVVMITVSDDGDRCLAVGARRVLQKPFTRAELAAVLAGLVAPGRGESAGGVLVVDDNVNAVELVAEPLRAEGYAVLRAYGGVEAIRVAREALPDLVILDLVMPEVNGFAVARALRESPATAHIPIVVVTAKDLTREERAQLEGDVSAVLAKSGFDREHLLAEIRRAVAAAACVLLMSFAPQPAAAAGEFTLCTSETPFLPLSSADPARPGSSQVLVARVAAKMGIAVRNVFAPWKRCQALVESGIHDAMNIAGFAGINPTIAVFPMRDGGADTSKSLGTVPSVLYRRVGSRADLVGGRIVGTDKPVAVLVTRQVNMDAVRRAGGTSEDGAKTVAALAQKLVAGQVDLAASAETEFADLVATTYKGILEAVATPLVESHYFVAFSRQYYAAHREEVETFWDEIARARQRPDASRESGRLR